MNVPLLVYPVWGPTALSREHTEAADGLLRASVGALLPPRGVLERWGDRMVEAELDRDRLLWVATRGSELVGVLDGRLHHPGPGTLTIAQLVVASTARRSGIGRALVHAAAATQHATSLEAYLVHAGAESAEFWPRVGFLRNQATRFVGDCASVRERTRGHSAMVLSTRAGDPGASLALRRQVFIEEQAVPEELEVDGLDPDCVHLWCEDGRGVPLAAGRLRFVSERTAKVERMCVDPSRRGTGLGRWLMDHVERRAAVDGAQKIVLNAQVAVEEFYRRLGYAPEGDRFEEAGIAHVRMTKPLGSTSHWG